MAPKKTSEASDSAPKQPNCSWSDADETILLRVLKEQKEKYGNQSGAGWKRAVWTAAEVALQTEGVLMKGSGPKTWNKCQDHWGAMKKNFVDVDALRHASGFGWDDGTKRVVATDSVWDAYLKTRKAGIAKWRNASFPFYDEMYFLVNGIVATGADVFHPGQSPAPTTTTATEDSDNDATSALSDAEPGSAGSAQNILNDATALEIMDDDDPATPAPTRSRKRVRAPTESPLASPAVASSSKRQDPSSSAKRPRRGRRHTSQADSILGVGDAITQIAAALSSGGDLATPVRRKKALELVDRDAEYSSDEEDRIISLFSENMVVADTYSSILKKSKRVKFVRGQLSKLIETD